MRNNLLYSKISVLIWHSLGCWIEIWIVPCLSNLGPDRTINFWFSTDTQKGGRSARRMKDLLLSSLSMMACSTWRNRYFPTQFPAPSFVSSSAILAAAFSKAAFRIAMTLPRKSLSTKATIGWSESHSCSFFNFHPLERGALLSSFALNCQRCFK